MKHKSKDKNKRLKSGFTLIELVVVIAIMSILALIVVPNLTAYVKKADEAKIIQNLKTFYQASELVDKTESEYYLHPNTESAEMSFMTKAGEYSNVTDGSELELYNVGKYDNGQLFAQYYSEKYDKFYTIPDEPGEPDKPGTVVIPETSEPTVEIAPLSMEVMMGAIEGYEILDTIKTSVESERIKGQYTYTFEMPYSAIHYYGYSIFATLHGENDVIDVSPPFGKYKGNNGIIGTDSNGIKLLFIYDNSDVANPKWILKSNVQLKYLEVYSNVG